MVQEVQYTQRHPSTAVGKCACFYYAYLYSGSYWCFMSHIQPSLPSSLYSSQQELQSVINSILVGPSSSHSKSSCIAWCTQFGHLSATMFCTAVVSKSQTSSLPGSVTCNLIPFGQIQVEILSGWPGNSVPCCLLEVLSCPCFHNYCTFWFCSFSNVCAAAMVVVVMVVYDN
jgi:hypothetical protein